MKSLNISRLGLVIALVAGVALSWTSLTPQALNASEIAGGWCGPDCTGYYEDGDCDDVYPECCANSFVWCVEESGTDVCISVKAGCIGSIRCAELMNDDCVSP